MTDPLLELLMHLRVDSPLPLPWAVAHAPDGRLEHSLPALWTASRDPIALLWASWFALDRAALVRVGCGALAHVAHAAPDDPFVARARDAAAQWAAGRGSLEACLLAHYAADHARDECDPDEPRWMIRDAAAALCAVPFVVDAMYEDDPRFAFTPAVAAASWALRQCGRASVPLPDHRAEEPDWKAYHAAVDEALAPMADLVRAHASCPAYEALVEAYRAYGERPLDRRAFIVDVGAPLATPTLAEGVARMVLEVMHHPAVALRTVRIAPGASDAALAAAAAKMGGALPAGMEALYRVMNGFELEWTLDVAALRSDPALAAVRDAFDDEALDQVAAGARDPFGLVNFRPLDDIVRDWKDSVWFDFDEGDAYRYVKPFDTFVAEARAALYPVPGPDSRVFFLDTRAHATGHTFAEYVELLRAARGFWYWSLTLTEARDERSVESEQFFRAMPALFPGFDPTPFVRKGAAYSVPRDANASSG